MNSIKLIIPKVSSRFWLVIKSFQYSFHSASSAAGKSAHVQPFPVPDAAGPDVCSRTSGRKDCQVTILRRPGRAAQAGFTQSTRQQ
jgi:hypothetical protein